MTQKRQPRGIPTGGQFSANEHDEAPPLEQAASSIAEVNDAAHRNDVDATIAALSEFSRVVGEAEERARKRKKEKSLERRRNLYAAKKAAGTLPKKKTKRDLETERIHDLADAEFHRSRHGEPEGLSPWAELP